jgi:hypothetical protein
MVLANVVSAGFLKEKTGGNRIANACDLGILVDAAFIVQRRTSKIAHKALIIPPPQMIERTKTRFAQLRQ